MPDHRSTRSDTAVVVAAIAVILFVMVGVGLASYLAGRDNSSRGMTTSHATSAGSLATVSPQVAAGAHAFVQFACAQCHGDRGAGGVSADVPGLQGVAQQMTAAQMRSIINHGAGGSSDPTRPFMPVWHGVVAAGQIAALIAYMKAGFPAVQYAAPEPIPSNQGDAVAGAALYDKYGCVNCHGPNGLGGVPNPQSPDTTI